MSWTHKNFQVHKMNVIEVYRLRKSKSTRNPIKITISKKTTYSQVKQKCLRLLNFSEVAREFTLLTKPRVTRSKIYEAHKNEIVKEKVLFLKGSANVICHQFHEMGNFFSKFFSKTHGIRERLNKGWILSRDSETLKDENGNEKLFKTECAAILDKYLWILFGL